jgi:hypothetical protein
MASMLSMMSSSPPDQLVDVFAVEGGDERTVQPVQRLVGQAVGGVFFVADALDVVVLLAPDNASPLRRKVLGGRDGVPCQPPRTVDRRPCPCGNRLNMSAFRFRQDSVNAGGLQSARHAYAKPGARRWEGVSWRHVTPVIRTTSTGRVMHLRRPGAAYTAVFAWGGCATSVSRRLRSHPRT